MYTIEELLQSLARIQGSEGQQYPSRDLDKTQ
jgi:hypothetical protein